MLYFPFCGMFHKLHYGDNNFLVNNTKGLSIDGFFCNLNYKTTLKSLAKRTKHNNQWNNQFCAKSSPKVMGEHFALQLTSEGRQIGLSILLITLEEKHLTLAQRIHSVYNTMSPDRVHMHFAIWTPPFWICCSNQFRPIDWLLWNYNIYRLLIIKYQHCITVCLRTKRYVDWAQSYICNTLSIWFRTPLVLT